MKTVLRKEGEMDDNVWHFVLDSDQLDGRTWQVGFSRLSPF